jgi:hypothetical protein
MDKAIAEFDKYGQEIRDTTSAANDFLHSQQEIASKSLNMHGKIGELKSYAQQFFSVTNAAMLARRAL